MFLSAKEINSYFTGLGNSPSSLNHLKPNDKAEIKPTSIGDVWFSEGGGLLLL